MSTSCSTARQTNYITTTERRRCNRAVRRNTNRGREANSSSAEIAGEWYGACYNDRRRLNGLVYGGMVTGSGGNTGKTGMSGTRGVKCVCVAATCSACNVLFSVAGIQN